MTRGGAEAQRYQAAFNTLGIPITWGAVETDSGKIDYAPFDAMFDWATTRARLLRLEPERVLESGRWLA